MGKSIEQAENLIYELAAEGIEGTLEEGVFKFTSTPEEVISKIDELLK
jgi:predicted RNase H-like HicB family nuclease